MFPAGTMNVGPVLSPCRDFRMVARGWDTPGDEVMPDRINGRRKVTEGCRGKRSLRNDGKDEGFASVKRSLSWLSRRTGARARRLLVAAGAPLFDVEATGVDAVPADFEGTSYQAHTSFSPGFNVTPILPLVPTRANGVKG